MATGPPTWAPVSDPELLTVGRVNLDLYAQQVDAPFVEIESFDAMVGGSPVNVAIAAARLGVRAAVFTAVGEDLVGDWVLHALARERVDTAFAFRRRGPHTSLALLSQRPPDRALNFYRQDPADMHLTADDAARLPLASAQSLLISVDALARGSTPAAVHWILDHPRPTTYLDLDLRMVNWTDRKRYAAAAATAIGRVDVVIGTEAEFAAVLDVDEQRVTDAAGDRFPGRVLIVKHGERGSTLLAPEGRHQVPAFPVQEASTVGAGDSFAAGLIRARLSGEDWPDAARFASATAACTVSRHGCSRGFPRLDEVEAMLDRPAVGAR